MTDQTLPRPAVSLATSTYALCFYADGHAIARNPDAMFRLPFLQGQALTPIGLYTIEAGEAGFTACLDGTPVAGVLPTDIDARAAAVSHYAGRAIETTFGMKAEPAVRLRAPAEA